MGDYFGMYRGFVRNNDDPQQRGRLKLEVPEVLQDNITGWALPCLPYAGNDVGSIFIPEEDDIVWVQFEGGDPNKPVWIGQTITGNKESAESPDEMDEDYPETQIIKTDQGHKIIFEDNPDDPRLIFEHSSGSREVFFNGDNVSGSKLVDLLGDLIMQASGNVKIKGESNLGLISGLTMQIDSQGTMTISTGENPAGTMEFDSGLDIAMEANTGFDLSTGLDISMESDAGFDLSTNTAVEVDSDTTIDLSAQTLSTISAEQVVLDGTTVSLGGDSASHPVTYGDLIVQMLQQIQQVFMTHTHSGVMSGPSTTSVPNNQLSINPSTAISSTVFTE